MHQVEMAADTLYKAKTIRGLCRLAVDQEAVSIGSPKDDVYAIALLSDEFIYGFSHFTQKRDPTSRRGYEVRPAFS